MEAEISLLMANQTLVSGAAVDGAFCFAHVVGSRRRESWFTIPS
jgi:hypothetical protein